MFRLSDSPPPVMPQSTCTTVMSYLELPLGGWRKERSRQSTVSVHLPMFTSPTSMTMRSEPCKLKKCSWTRIRCQRRMSFLEETPILHETTADLYKVACLLPGYFYHYLIRQTTTCIIFIDNNTPLNESKANSRYPIFDLTLLRTTYVKSNPEQIQLWSLSKILTINRLITRGSTAS